MLHDCGERLYTLKEIAKRLKMTVPTIRHYARCGRLEAVKFGREFRVTESALARFLAAPGK